MATKIRRNNNLKKDNYNIVLILPLILIVAMVPLIVRLKIIPLTGVSATLKANETINADLFSYYKMQWFLIFTTMGILMFAYRYLIQKDISIKKTSLYYPMVGFIILVILSTIFATHGDVVLNGFMDRYEGAYVLIAYMICLFLAINFIDEEKQVKYILVSLGLSSLLLSTIGILQFFGHDIFSMELGKKLIISSKYIDSIESMQVIFGIRNIYGTLNNPNYVGVYMSILFPLLCTIMLLSKDKLLKLFFGIISILSIINLFGSGSRTGIISLLLYIFLLVLVFRRRILKQWKVSLFLMVLLVIVFFGINKATEGMLKDRILAVKDLTSDAMISNLKDIVLEENRAKIVIDDYEINIISGESGLSFIDKEGEVIETLIEGGLINFVSEPYNIHSFNQVIYQEGLVLNSSISTNKNIAYFNLIIDHNNEFRYLNYKGEIVDFKEVPYLGFEGRENMASNRGYIWSRSIPLLKDTIFIGNGPDTYALHFPQDDYLGRIQGGMPINTLVDKPHNMYLQTAINTGIISLIAMLSIFFIYLKSSIKVYIKKKSYDNFFEIAGVSIFFAVCSYLMVGLLNDSVVSIAPVFWILLGTGMSINMKLRDQLE